MTKTKLKFKREIWETHIGGFKLSSKVGSGKSVAEKDMSIDRQETNKVKIQEGLEMWSSTEVLFEVQSWDMLLHGSDTF
jgi:hypothetical protein